MNFNEELQSNNENKRKMEKPSTSRKRWQGEESVAQSSNLNDSCKKVMKMKIHSEGVIWELNEKLHRSEATNQELQKIIQDNKFKYEKLKLAHQELKSTEDSTRTKINSIQEMMCCFSGRIQDITSSFDIIGKEKGIIKTTFDYHVKQVQELKNNFLTIQKEYVTQIDLLKEKVDDKCALVLQQEGRISNLNNYVNTLKVTNDDLKNANQLLESSNASINFNIQELSNNFNTLKQNYDKLQVESSVTNNQLNLSLMDMKKQCEVKDCQLQQKCQELIHFQEREIELLRDIEILKKEILCKDQQYAEYKTAMADKMTEIANKNKTMEEEMEGLKIRMVEQQTILEESLAMVRQEEEHAKNALTATEQEVQQMKQVLERAQHDLEESKAQSKRLERELDVQKVICQEDREQMENVNNEKSRVAEAREMELLSKIKKLQNEIVIKSEEFSEMEKNYLELSDIHKKYKLLETKYKSVLERFEVTQMEFKNVNAKEKSKMVVASSLVGSSSAELKSFPQRDPESTIRKPFPKYSSPMSESEESDISNIDNMLFYKKLEHLNKEEQQKNMTKRHIAKSKK